MQLEATRPRTYWEAQAVELGSAPLCDLLRGQPASARLVLPPYSLAVLRRAAG